MKKILALTIAVLMLLVCFTACSKENIEDDNAGAFKEEVVLMYENFYYSTNDDGTYEITGIRLITNDHVDVEIPTEIEGREVTGIAADAFKSINTIESIEIPEGILYIGDYAFYGCTALKNVNVPASLETIGKGAFEGCVSLKKLDVAEDSGLMSVGNYAFKDCTALEFFSFSGVITTVGDAAFMNCDALTSVSLQANVAKLGKSAFAACEKLDSIYVANDKLEIGDGAFFTGADKVTVTANEGSTAETYAAKNSNYIVFEIAE